MRSIERIEPFLEKVDINKLFKDIWKLPEYSDPDKMESLLAEDYDIILSFWKDNPDLRFSQLLISMNYIPNILGFWYYMKEEEILEKLKKLQ